MPELLVYWIQERENIRRKKEAGDPKPWSDDWVFQKTYFCNVHREDDRVTQWIRRNYTPAFFGENYELAIVGSRLFNRTETLRLLKPAFMDPDFPMALKGILEAMKREGKQIWSGAYVITTHGMKMPKLDYCVDLLNKAAKYYLPVNDHVPEDTCREYWHHIQQISGLGSFLAAQVVADLKNTRGHPLHRAGDWRTFSAPGPGSERGLSWYFDTKVTYASYHEHINQVARDMDWFMRPGNFCMQDLQNCLCEFDKYCRVLSGTGRSKRKYPGLDPNMAP